MKQNFIIRSKQDTKDLAGKLSQKIKSGDILALYGELGSGKTYFTQQLCKFLRVRENVSSPSYVLMNEYWGKLPVYHFDLYRLNDREELLELGLEEYLEKGLIVIEWPELAEEFLAGKMIKLFFSFENEHRKIVLIDERK